MGPGPHPRPQVAKTTRQGGERERSDPAPGQQIHKNQAGIPMALCPERGNTEGIEAEAPAMDDTPPNQVPGVR